MRKRDPRRLLLRRQPERALVRIVGRPESTTAPDGSVTTKQVADVTLPCSELDKIWSPEYLERLARTYWRFLTRFSLGLLRVLYTPDSREIVVRRRPFVLLTFHAPEYDIESNRGTVTWRIKKGLLVAKHGRGKGFLRMSVERPPTSNGSMVTVRVTSEVANFYPTIGSWGGITKIGRLIYRITQLRIHVIVTNAFLRSLARLDLAPSVVGALRDDALAALAAGDVEKAQVAERTADVEEARIRSAMPNGEAGRDEQPPPLSAAENAAAVGRSAAG